MSRITIREADLTRLGNTNLSSEVVYVPGFATTDPDYINETTRVAKGIPTLCSTIAEFEAYFGSIPAVFTTDQAYPAAFAEDAKPSGNMFNAGDVDPSYVYARELINAGIPVLYERINEDLAGISVDNLYSSLTTNLSGMDELMDTGEYSVKYITTGGYPSFEFGAVADPDYDIGNIQVLSKELAAAEWMADGQDTFKAQLSSNDMLPESTATLVIAYDGTNWKLTKGESSVNVTLANWGIDYIGTPSGPVLDEWDGDTLSILVIVTPQTSNGLVDKLLAVAASRGDCVALIDHTNNPSRPLNSGDAHSVYHSISDSESPYMVASNGEYGAMFTPWCNVNFVALVSAKKNDTYEGINYDEVQWRPSAMPASFEYLMSLAYSIRNNASWLAVAGVTRGIVPNFVSLNIEGRLTNAIAESYQEDDKISINPITNIKPYGFTIWGNRTLKNNTVTNGLTATSFLNIRNMVSDIKKTAITAAKVCIFEQNVDILWINFKSYITPLLDQMTSGYGISGYRIIKNESPSPVKIIATIRIYPIYAVESFDITIELSSETLER